MRRELIAGRYELERLLGRGGMGEVWAARDRSLRRPVAVKLLRVGGMPDRELVARFEREAIAAAQINHPNVVALHDRGVHDDLLYIVMERVDGAPLAELLRRQGPLPVDRALALAEEICAALAAAHEAGVIHYDIKPQNIMVTSSGHVKVVDFGIAGFAQTMASVVRSALLSPAGTPEYGAPEQFTAARGDERADLYSLGCVLFAMLAGRPPFQSPDTLALIRRKCAEDPPRLDAFRADLPRALTDFTAELLAREPARRPRTVRDAEVRLTLIRQELSTGPTQQRAPIRSTTREPPDDAEPTRRASPSILPDPVADGAFHYRAAHVALAVLGALALIASGVGLVVAFQPDARGSSPNGYGHAHTASPNTSAATDSSTDTPPSGGTSGRITVAYLSLCLDDRGAVTTAGSPVEVNVCDSTGSQDWTVRSDGSLRIVGFCLDLNGGSTANGTTAVLAACDGSAPQRWTRGPGYTLVNAASGTCLSDVGFGWQTNPVGIWSCSGDESQQWHLPSDPGTALPLSAGSSGSAIGYQGLCLNAQPTGAAASYTVDVATCDGSATQQWTVESDGTIHALGMCLDVSGGGTVNGTIVDLYTCNGTTAQEWAQGQATTMYGYPASPGIKLNGFAGVVVNPASGRCLSDTGFGGAGNQVSIWDCSGDASQQWTLP